MRVERFKKWETSKQLELVNGAARAEVQTQIELWLDRNYRVWTAVWAQNRLGHLGLIRGQFSLEGQIRGHFGREGLIIALRAERSDQRRIREQLSLIRSRLERTYQRPCRTRLSLSICFFRMSRRLWLCHEPQKKKSVLTIDPFAVPCLRSEWSRQIVQPLTSGWSLYKK